MVSLPTGAGEPVSSEGVRTRGPCAATGSADVAQMAERLICNQQVAGSIPAVGSGDRNIPFGEVPKRPTGADCKSAGVRLRRFESSPLHSQERAVYRGGSSVGRASAFQAECRGFESRSPLFSFWVEVTSQPRSQKCGRLAVGSVRQIRSREATIEHGWRWRATAELTGPGSSVGRARPW